MPTLVGFKPTTGVLALSSELSKRTRERGLFLDRQNSAYAGEKLSPMRVVTLSHNNPISL